MSSLMLMQYSYYLLQLPLSQIHANLLSINPDVLAKG